MSVTCAELRWRWIQRVRALTGSESYTVGGAKNDDTFRKAAERITMLRLDVDRFIDAQINHIISHNKQASIWPTLMLGDAALDRYMREPQGEDSLRDLQAFYTSQAEVFNRICNALGDEVAFSNRVTQYSPLFLAYMHFSTGRNMTLELAGDARSEVEAHPLVKQIFPAQFLEAL